MRKFADKQAKNRQTDVSTTESTLILFGSSLDTRGSWPITLLSYLNNYNIVLHNYRFHGKPLFHILCNLKVMNIRLSRICIITIEITEIWRRKDCDEDTA